MRLFVILLIAVILTPIFTTSAQVGGSISDITGENASIVLNPQFPNPGDRVEATIDDYSVTNNGAQITWYFDGLSAPAVDNDRKITFTAPPIGKSMNILARLDYGGGRMLEAKKTIKPLYLDVIIEPQTYTPLFYEGHTLPVHGSRVNILALVQDSNGPVNPSDYSYNWSLNNKSVYGGPRFGGEWAEITIPHGRSSLITVTVNNRNGETVARKVVAIPSVSIELHFYEVSTLLGISKKSITNNLILSGNSASVRAVPYYVDLNVSDISLFAQWSINNRPVQTDDADPFEINLTRGNTGTANVSFKLINRDQLLQSDEESFQITL